MSDRYQPGHGHPRRVGHYDRYDEYDRNTRYSYDERYESYPRYDRSERSRPPPPPQRQGYDRYDRNDDYRRSNEYSFRGAADRGSTYRPQPPQSDFTFRPNGPAAPSFPEPQQRRSQALSQQAQPPRPKNSRRDQGKRGPVGHHGERRPAQGGRGGFRRPPPAAHERDILRRQHGGSTPEQLHGMNQDGQFRFLEVDLSSSDDEEQGSEDGEIEDDLSEGEGPRKRVKADVTAPAEQTAPKWSNPEYFTALPPPESGLAPKKDIVQVIRKAKVEAMPKQDSTSNAVKDNADFISFNMDDDDMSVSDEESISVQPSPKKRPSKELDDIGSPPEPPSEIDQLMNMAGRMAVKGNPKQPPKERLQPLPPPPAQHIPQPTPQGGPDPKGKKRKAAEISKGLGSVVSEWQSNETNPTPWCTIDHTRTASVGLRLHKEIADFYEFVRPHDYEEAVRHELIQRVQKAITGPGAKDVEIRSFGSFASGLYLPTADMDLVAVSREYLRHGVKVFCQSSNKMFKLGNHLRNGIAQEGTLTVVTRAKVPIIKFTDKVTGIKVDISFENDTGLIANRTFAEWKEKYPAMPVVVVLIKQMLAMRGLNEVFLGGLGGFSIICLVVSMMQLMPELQSGNMDPQLHYGELLLNFLDLYGNKFNLQTTGITMDPPGYFDKIRNPQKKQNANGLTIVDPNKADNDISGGSHKIQTVFECFRTAHSEIQRRLAQVHSGENIEDSILGCIWGGNYTSFIHQRNKLSLLHRGQAISPPPVPAPKEPKKPKKLKKPKQTGPPNHNKDSHKHTKNTYQTGQGNLNGTGRPLRSHGPPNPPAQRMRRPIDDVPHPPEWSYRPPVGQRRR